MGRRGGERWGYAAVALAAVLAVGLGLTKTFAQRANLPDYARVPYNNYDGFVAIDQFAKRAELFGAWFAGEDRGELSAFLTADLHPTSIAVPAAVGLLSRLVDPCPGRSSVYPCWRPSRRGGG